MHTCTSIGRWLGVVLLAASFVGTAYAQRTVTLTLNSATIPDTTKPTGFMEVRGAVDPGTGYEAPYTYTNGGATIDWSDMSTIEPVNIGGDYWQVSFQVDNNVTTQFKFYSQQTQDGGFDGWEIDPNPTIGPGTTDTTLAVHFFEFNGTWQGRAGDKGPYDWRPYESKQDSIAIWFRVYACTDAAQNNGYNPNDLAQSLAVRGDPLNGLSQLTWGDDTGVSLARESSVNGSPGFDLYSGVAYYPTAATGMSQDYKFFINGAVNGWEDVTGGGNRSFTVPGQDSTLYYSYYGDSAPATCGLEPTAGSVVFQVDTTPLEQIGIFDKARGDTLQVRGGFNGWDCDNPDDCLLGDVPGTNVFEAEVALVLIPGTEQEYKFLIDFNDVNFVNEFGKDPPGGWEEPISTQGSNRRFTYDGMDAQFLGEQFFNDVLPGNIIETGSVDVSFAVDMTPALDQSLPQPFDVANDTPYVDVGGDPIWAFTQGLPADPGTPGFDGSLFFLFDDNNDMIYTGTLTVMGPSHSGIQYQYGYAGDNEDGAGTSGLGRRRTRFIVPNPDGTWPSEYAIVQESYQPTGPLPYDQNPAVGTAIEPVDGELPASISLSANYPNPFNPSTTFEYAIDRSVQVKLQVFDVLGRLVTTLYDGIQKPATYQVTFDASRLASGVYMYRLETPDKVLTRQMLLIK